MSLFHPTNVYCPSCNALVSMDAVGSVNADRRPDLREAILDNTFQEATCSECGASFRLQPEFNYLDVEHGHWIAGLPASKMPDYLEVEDEARSLFEASYGAGAPQSARDVGDGLDMRVTFGWPAIREKLLIRKLNLDDLVLETLKLDLLRRLPEAPLEPGVELRLRGLGEDGGLEFVWIRSDTEEVLGAFVAPRELYQAVEENETGWAQVRGELANGPFIDMQKLYMGAGR